MKKIGVSIPWDYLSGKIIIKESKIFSHNNESIIVTLHPFTGSESISKYREQTIYFIKKLDNCITEKNLPIKLALENQRSKKINDPGGNLLCRHQQEALYKEVYHPDHNK